MARLIDADEVVAILQRVAAPPTAPYHEWAVLDAIRAELERGGVPSHVDRYGQVYARTARGTAKRALVLAAHTDHPGFDVIEAEGRVGRVRVLGGFRQRLFPKLAAVTVHDDDGQGSFRGTLSDPETVVDPVHNSTNTCRIDAERTLEVGQFAMLDLPPVEVAGDEIRMRAADDLAGCALIVCALLALRDEPRPHDVHAVFTRGEESGLYGARLVAEDGLLPRDVVVVSLEASRALAHAAPGRGVVVRAGDVYNTFDNDAERFLRVAREELTSAGVATQRALLTGGTCESSAFVRLGWSATGIAVPNVNYHNQGEHSHTFTSEVVRLSDLRSAVALLVEAAAAAGVDAEESWWPDVKIVPRQIRELLRIRR